MGLVADDLTGAADAGVQFAEFGFRAVVQLTLSTHVSREATTADVLILNTDTRLGSPSTAARDTAKAIRILRRAGCDQIFLKVDSSLRGHIGECVRSALGELPGRIALVAPANPQQGRTTLGGIQLVHGVPVAEADEGRDTASPARVSHLPSLLLSAAVPTIQAVGKWWLNELSSTEMSGAIVFDAIDDASLNRVARAALTGATDYLFVGSAGLARAVAESTTLRSGATRETGRPDPIVEPSGATSPVLTVNGSVKKTSQQQVEFHESLGARVVRLSATELLTPGGSKMMAELALRHLERKDDVIVTVSNGIEGPSGASEVRESSTRLALALGNAAARAVREGRVENLILNGGDTALATCRCLGIHSLRLIEEALVGVPYVRPMQQSVRFPKRILTKAGGFGADETLHRGAEWLKRTAGGSKNLA